MSAAAEAEAAAAASAGGAPELLLVTAFHPFVYEGGEGAFLPPELAALAERVRAGALRVRIAPLDRSERVMPLPADVRLDTTLAATRRAHRVADVLLAWRWPGFGAELHRGLRLGGLVGVVRVWRWAAVARATARWLALPAQQSATLGYSYWRGGATLALARWAAARPGRAAITRVHRFELYDEAFSPPFQPWTSVYAGLQATVVIAEHGRRYLLQRGVPAERLHLARLGTPPMPAARASDDGTWRVLSVSFLRPEKRVPLLAAALVRLARQRPGQAIAWTHLGDGPERSAVRAAAAAAPGNLTVHLRGAVDPAAVRRHYADAAVDLFVQASASEGLPVAVMEALGAGVPVLATDVGGVAEAVDDEVGALLPAAVDAAALAMALKRLLGDAAALQRRRAAAAARWAASFDSRVTQAAWAGWLVAQARAVRGEERAAPPVDTN
jgi:glycosyltransferase involved in cell wall biosynthesis